MRSDHRAGAGEPRPDRFSISVCPSPEGVAVTGRLMQVRVSDCTQLPCPLRKRTQATIEIDFIPSKIHPSVSVDR